MEKSFVFNSINGDRKYKAEDFREYFSSFIGNGIFPNPSDCLQVMGNNNNMTVTIKAGKGWINGAIYTNTGDFILNIDVADGILNRIDRIALRFDTVGRAITIAVKKGTFSSSPTPPELERDADFYELGLADIYIQAGAVQITQADITDLRLNKDLCGVVHGTIDQVDTTTIFNQFESWYTQKTGQYQSEMSGAESQFKQDFTNWFNEIKNLLSTDVAGSLLNKINDLAGDERTNETVKKNADDITSLTKTVNSHLEDSTKQFASVNKNISTLKYRMYMGV